MLSFGEYSPCDCNISFAQTDIVKKLLEVGLS